MRAAGQSKDRRQYGEGAQQLQTAVRDFNDVLEDADEPEEAKEEEQALIDALNKFSGTVGRINDAVQRDDEAAIRTEIATLQPQAQQVESAGEALENAVE
jgi:predicted nucleotidyltransferase